MLPSFSSGLNSMLALGRMVRGMTPILLRPSTLKKGSSLGSLNANIWRFFGLWKLSSPSGSSSRCAHTPAATTVFSASISPLLVSAPTTTVSCHTKGSPGSPSSSTGLSISLVASVLYMTSPPSLTNSSS